MRGWAALLLVVCLSLGLRCVHLSQSLWCDEMSTLLQYVEGPWQRVIAPRPGEYVPNNHVLFTAVAKLAYSVATFGRAHVRPPHEVALRLPAWLAGSRCLLTETPRHAPVAD